MLIASLCLLVGLVVGFMIRKSKDNLIHCKSHNPKPKGITHPSSSKGIGSGYF